MRDEPRGSNDERQFRGRSSSRPERSNITRNDFFGTQIVERLAVAATDGRQVTGRISFDHPPRRAPRSDGQPSGSPSRRRQGPSRTRRTSHRPSLVVVVVAPRGETRRTRRHIAGATASIEGVGRGTLVEPRPRHMRAFRPPATTRVIFAAPGRPFAGILQRSYAKNIGFADER